MRRKFKMTKWGLLLPFLAIAVSLIYFFCSDHANLKGTFIIRSRFLRSTNNSNDSPWRDLNEVKLERTPGHIVMDNGIVQVTISTPDGDVVGIRYNGIDNFLETKNAENDRGYWDAVWNRPGQPISTDKFRGSSFRVIVENHNQLEISFKKTWSLSKDSSAPVTVDKRYIMVGGSSGFYTYAIFERPVGWPAIEMDQLRIVFKLQNQKFEYLAIADKKQRVMPTQIDREKGEPLAYPEAVRLINPANATLRGEVDDKYQYSLEEKDNRVHGWICKKPAVGFWLITPSNEFRMGGPFKQDLTSHVGPTTLSMFVSTHYSGTEVGMKFGKGEPWNKVFGPVFVYLNSVPKQQHSLSLWQNAKQQMVTEVNSWPYSFPQSVDFPSSKQRGSLSGRLLLNDSYISSKGLMGARNAFVGLALPGIVGSWQRESKGYQFWTQADNKGNFLIKNVRPGVYNLYAFVPGFIGDYKYDSIITIQSGSQINLAALVYAPPRQGPTLWEIGIPDRTAAEFYVPDPNPNFVNKLYINNPEKFRQYGLWERYADLYPKKDLVFTIGVSDYRKDWFFAHVTRHVGNNIYQATTWQIVFSLKTVNRFATYTLQIALASAAECELQVRVNDPKTILPVYTTGFIGRDNAIARHGIHGLYWLFSVNIPGNLLHQGSNSIYLTQSRHQSPFQGFMYDYIRFEGPPHT